MSPGGGTLTGGLVQEEGSSDADVERLDLPAERDRHSAVACTAYERAYALALGTEHQRDAAGQIRLPHRRAGRAGCLPDPQLWPLDLGEVGGQVGNYRHGDVLDRAGRSAANRRGHANRPVRWQ